MMTETEKLVEVALEICRAVAELPDRDSPADWPEAMLVTHDELNDIVLEKLRELIASSGATTQAVRMLTEDEQAAIIDMHSTGRAQGDHECAEDIQHKFAEVNGLRIPADGKIGSAA